MAPLFASFFSPGCPAGHIGSPSLALAIKGCTGRELYSSSAAKALTTADYASCCHLYIQQYVISFLSSSLSSWPVFSFFFSLACSLSDLSLSLSSLAMFCLFRLSTLICVFIHLSAWLTSLSYSGFLVSFLMSTHSDSSFDLCSFFSPSFSHFSLSLALPLFSSLIVASLLKPGTLTACTHPEY